MIFMVLVALYIEMVLRKNVVCVTCASELFGVHKSNVKYLKRDNKSE